MFPCLLFLLAHLTIVVPPSPLPDPRSSGLQDRTAEKVTDDVELVRVTSNVQDPELQRLACERKLQRLAYK